MDPSDSHCRWPSPTSVLASPDRDAELAGLVGEVVLNAATGKDDYTDGQDVEHAVVALKGSGVGVAGPVGLEGDLWHMAVVGPGRRNAFGTLRRTAVQQNHVGMLCLPPQIIWAGQSVLQLLSLGRI
jgi:hypothetical protein